MRIGKSVCIYTDSTVQAKNGNIEGHQYVYQPETCRTMYIIHNMYVGMMPQS
jgi:hypothetical protein